jgi:hypothetical protein
MRYGKLAVSLTAAAMMGAFGSAYAQQTYNASESGSPTNPPNAVLDSDTSMRNTDQNAPSSVQENSGMTSQGSSSVYSDPAYSDPATPQTGSSTSVDQPVPPDASSNIDHDQALGSTPSATGESSSSGSSGISGGAESVTK